jgi:hypothetical protein
MKTVDKIEQTFDDLITEQIIVDMVQNILKDMYEFMQSFETEPYFALESGWQAGVLGLNPEYCPYHKYSKEYREWHSFYNIASELTNETPNPNTPRSGLN